KVRSRRAYAPQVPRQPHRRSGPGFVDALRQPRSHVVPFQVAEQPDDGLPGTVLVETAETPADVAGGIADDVVRMILGQVERNRERGIEIARNGILAG